MSLLLGNRKAPATTCFTCNLRVLIKEYLTLEQWNISLELNDVTAHDWKLICPTQTAPNQKLSHRSTLERQHNMHFCLSLKCHFILEPYDSSQLITSKAATTTLNLSILKLNKVLYTHNLYLIYSCFSWDGKDSYQLNIDEIFRVINVLLQLKWRKK